MYTIYDEIYNPTFYIQNNFQHFSTWIFNFKFIAHIFYYTYIKWEYYMIVMFNLNIVINCKATFDEMRFDLLLFKLHVIQFIFGIWIFC